MTKETSNIGQTGINSIRIGGMTMDDLPIAEAAHAKQQLPEVYKNEKEQKIATIKKRYPTQDVKYLKSRLTEAQQNIKRVKKLITEQMTMISDYTGHISLCKMRDKMVEAIDDGPEKEAKVKSLYKQYPPYDVEKMQQQIVQCHEAIERANEVIEKENDDIGMLRELIALCKKRDEEIRNVK